MLIDNFSNSWWKMQNEQTNLNYCIPLYSTGRRKTKLLFPGFGALFKERFSEGRKLSFRQSEKTFRCLLKGSKESTQYVNLHPWRFCICSSLSWSLFLSSSYCKEHRRRIIHWTRRVVLGSTWYTCSSLTEIMPYEIYIHSYIQNGSKHCQTLCRSLEMNYASYRYSLGFLSNFTQNKYITHIMHIG